MDPEGGHSRRKEKEEEPLHRRKLPIHGLMAQNPAQYEQELDDVWWSTRCICHTFPALGKKWSGMSASSPRPQAPGDQVVKVPCRLIVVDQESTKTPCSSWGQFESIFRAADACHFLINQIHDPGAGW